MSFVIAVHVNEGIVLASDSRVVYQKKITSDSNTTVLMGINVTDTLNKTYKCANGVGISIVGDSSINGLPISGFVENFLRETVTDTTEVDDMPSEVLSHFKAIDPNLNAIFVIAGYKQTMLKGENQKDIKKYSQKLFKVNIKNNSIETIDTSLQGATWDGEIFVLSKIFKDTAVKQKDGYIDLPNYTVPWNLFTLQDAVHFARYAVDVTIQTMRFMNIVKTVGGPVDILIIRPSDTYWLEQKKLTASEG